MAFYYSDSVPINELHAFDVVVVDPDNNINSKKLDTELCKSFAYVSVSEINQARKYYNKILRNWIIGENPIWKTKILDPGNVEWRKFFLDEIIAPLWEQGYRGFFLDTLDFYNNINIAKNEYEKKTQINNLVGLLKSIKQKYPDAKLIFNRGFELLPEMHDLIYAVSAESLFCSWDQQAKKYTQVSLEDRNSLLKELEKVRQYNKPIIIIDYLQPEKRAEARLIANKIKALGFIPWVTDCELSTIGVGSIEFIPRKILAFYDGQATPSPMNDASVFTRATMPLEYLGYTPVLYDVQKFSLIDKSDKYCAGILIWLDTDHLKNSEKFRDWLIKQKESGIPIIIFGNITTPISKRFADAFGLSVDNKEKTPSSVKIIYASLLINYEIKAFPNVHNFLPITTQTGKTLLQLQDNLGRKMDAVAITPWGGYAVDPFLITALPNGQAKWIINPLEFFKSALKTTQMPVPDTTTENGRRLMFVHVDGDGFTSKAEWKPEWLASQAMQKEIFEYYKIPTTVSVIQGEIDKHPEAIKSARNIFSLPWIEIASHSYSHPFRWSDIKFSKLDGQDIWGDFELHSIISGYKFNLNTEITGSANFINSKLASNNKQTKVFLWSGDCEPPEKAVELAYQNGLLNMNGGNTVITNTQKSLTNIAPLGFYHGDYFQVFAQAQNENVHTNSWQGPYYGYRRVIETFKLTNEPLRFKPINIYYHFFSATKIASLKALKEVYTWALQQKVFNIYASEYIKKVLDFNNLILARKNNGWLIRTNGDLREFRISKNMGFPDLISSENVVGFSSYGNDYYIHLGSAKESFLSLTKQKPTVPYIEEANGSIIYFKRDHNRFSFKITSYTPLVFTLANMKNYKLYRNNKPVVEKTRSENKCVFEIGEQNGDNAEFIVTY